MHLPLNKHASIVDKPLSWLPDCTESFGDTSRRFREVCIIMHIHSGVGREIFTTGLPTETLPVKLVDDMLPALFQDQAQPSFVATTDFL